MRNTIACGFIEKTEGQGHPFPALPPKRFAEIGIHNVEIFWHDALTVDSIRAMIEPHGLSVTSLQVPCRLENDAVFGVFEEFAKRAIALGCPRLYASVSIKEMPFEKVCGRLSRIGDILGKYGLVLGMETRPPFCHNGDMALKTIEAVGHPSIRLNFDTGNIYFYNQNADVVGELKKVAKYVSSAHLKDTMGVYRDMGFTVLGKGIVDFPGVFKELAGIGFNGPYTIELEGKVLIPNLDTEDNIAATLIACMDYLRGKGLV